MMQLPIRPRAVLFTLLFAGLAASAVAADRRVAVRPFEVYNAADLEPSIPGLQSALASRLTAPGCQVFTLKPGEPAHGDWVVRVTLTRVGSRTSVDGSAEPVVGRGEVFRAYEIADSADGLFPALTTVATTLRKGILAAPAPVAQPAPPAAPAAPVATASAAPAAPATPVPASVPGPQAPASPVVTAPPGQPADPGNLAKTLLTYRIGAPIPGVALSMAVGDVDRDGAAELLVLTTNEIVAFRDDGKDLKLQWRVPVGRGVSPAYVSLGDVDGDGTPEVFVAGLRGGTPATEVYQWKSGALAFRGPVVPAFLRAVVHPEKGLLLLGMTAGDGKRLFSPGIRSFAWSKEAYRDGGGFPLPASTLVTDIDWHRVKDGEHPWTVLTTQRDTLRILDAEGKLFFDGSEEVKGSDNVLEAGDQAQQDRLDADIFRLQGKTLLWRDSAGTPHLLLQKNYAFTTLFQRSRSYSQGQILSFQWEGLGLAPSGQSPKIPGYLADVDLAPSKLRPAAVTLYAVLNQSKGIVFTDKTLRVLAWDL